MRLVRLILTVWHSGNRNVLGKGCITERYVVSNLTAMIIVTTVLCSTLLPQRPCTEINCVATTAADKKWRFCVLLIHCDNYLL